jgi:hypothetical protein
VLESLGRNSGRDPFPKMLSRSKLPFRPTVGLSLGSDRQHDARQPISEGHDARQPISGGHDARQPISRGRGGGAMGTVTHDDLRLGGEVGVYGRALKLHDCDQSTRAFYLEVRGGGGGGRPQNPGHRGGTANSTLIA